jgi:hypothetical protein
MAVYSLQFELPVKDWCSVLIDYITTSASLVPPNCSVFTPVLGKRGTDGWTFEKIL